MSGAPVPVVEAFYHPLTGAYAYLAFDARARQAVVIDAVLDFDRCSGCVRTAAADLILARIRELGLSVRWVLETHAHADHLSAATYLKDRLECPIGTGAGIRAVQSCTARMFGLEQELAADGSQFDRLWNDGDRYAVGDLAGCVLATPGHTPDCVTYLLGDCAFVGDTLFLPDLGTARCDFPGASASQLYDSVRRLYQLPGTTRVMVGHDYPPPGRKPAYSAALREEQERNVHLSASTLRAEFIAFREQRDRTLPLPELFFFALQVNVRGGRLPPPDANGMRHLRVPLSLPQGWPG